MKCRIVYKPDGTVSVIHPVPKSRRPEETEADWLERVFAKTMQGSPLNGLPFDDVDDTALPVNRDDRDAWEGTQGQGITINQVKADQIKVDKERTLKIDIEMRRMAEQNLIDKGEL